MSIVILIRYSLFKPFKTLLPNSRTTHIYTHIYIYIYMHLQEVLVRNVTCRESNADSSVVKPVARSGKVTGYMLDDRQRKNNFYYPTRPNLHFTWGYSQGQSNRGVKLTTFLRLMQRLRVSGGKPASRHMPSYGER